MCLPCPPTLLQGAVCVPLRASSLSSSILELPFTWFCHLPVCSRSLYLCVYLVFTLEAKNYVFFCIQGEETLTFTVGSVMEGLDRLLQRTFSLRMHPVAVAQGEVWHDSVVKLAMERYHADKEKWQPVGHLYCDFFQRPEKEGGDSHYTIRCGFSRPGQAPQTPQSVLSCTSHQNHPLSVASVRTFFHEFGHGLHSMMGQPHYQHMAGTRCSNDFAEVSLAAVDCDLACRLWKWFKYFTVGCFL